jgi:hypothetical protein
VRLGTEKPLLSFPCLVHLRIAFALVVLGR